MKLAVPFLQIPLQFDASVLAAEVLALGEEPWRPHPQGYPGNTALTLITTHGDPASDALGGAMRATPYLERCPYLTQVLASFGATLGRTRLMRLSGQAEVSQHVDIAYYWREHVRVHVPILTQPTVRFYCGNADLHMAAGECWIFDTWRMHKVVNDHELARIHLVVDTVGGAGFWRLLESARPAGDTIVGWKPEAVMPDDVGAPALDFEAVNIPTVMTPWELREHLAFLLGEAKPDAALPDVRRACDAFTHKWQALWACFGEGRTGWPRYRALLNEFGAYVDRLPPLRLENGVVLANAIKAIALKNALADGLAPAVMAMRGPQKQSVQVAWSGRR